MEQVTRGWPLGRKLLRVYRNSSKESYSLLFIFENNVEVVVVNIITKDDGTTRIEEKSNVPISSTKQ